MQEEVHKASHWLSGVPVILQGPPLQPEIWSGAQVWGRFQQLPTLAWPHESQPQFQEGWSCAHSLSKRCALLL